MDTLICISAVGFTNVSGALCGCVSINQMQMGIWYVLSTCNKHNRTKKKQNLSEVCSTADCTGAQTQSLTLIIDWDRSVDIEELFFGAIVEYCSRRKKQTICNILWAICMRYSYQTFLICTASFCTG